MIQKLIPFATTWLCENAFSAMCVYWKRSMQIGWKLKLTCGCA